MVSSLANNECNQMSLKVTATEFKPKKVLSRESKKTHPSARSSGGVCGCFGTHHACVGSCIGCGRIYCSEEEQLVYSGRCIFCKSSKVFASFPYSELSQESLGGIKGDIFSGVSKAYEVKDRLLQYDRESAKRTHVHDSQQDYYESSTWLSEEEKATIDRKRKKMMDAKKPSNRRYLMELKASRTQVTAKTVVVTSTEDTADEDEDEDGDIVHHITDTHEEMPPLNAGLERSQTKAGDIYRLLAESLAPWRSEKTTALK